jgi:uncharacterized protein
MTQKHCSQCHKPYEIAEGARGFAPFCSKRCADIDLGRWLKGDYVIGDTGALEIREGDETAEMMPVRIEDNEA